MRLSNASLVAFLSLGACTSPNVIQVSGAALPNKVSSRLPSSQRRQSPSVYAGRHYLVKQAMSIRGGGGSSSTASMLPFGLVLNKDLMAKVADLFFMGQASTAWLAPYRTCQKYGLSNKLINVATNRKLAAAYLGSAVLMYGLLFQKCTLNTAVGGAAVAWMMEQLKARLDYEAEKVGRPVIGEYLVAMCATLTAYATLYNTPWASLAIRISALLQLTAGLSFFLVPATMCKVWKVPVGISISPEDKKRLAEYKEQLKQYNEAVFLHRYMGVALVFAGILQTVLAWDGTVYKAIGSAYGFLFSINLWSFLKTSDFKRLARTSATVQRKQRTRPRWSTLFFPAFNGIIATSLLLQRSRPQILPVTP